MGRRRRRLLSPGPALSARAAGGGAAAAPGIWLTDVTMECPICAQDFPESQIEHHAWQCMEQHTPTEERAQEGEAVGECPLCFCPFSAELILEHAALCNGPSYVAFPEPAFSRQNQPQEKDLPSCSQRPQQDGPTLLTRNIMHLFNSYVNGTDPVAPSAVGWSVSKPRSIQEGDGESQDIDNVVHHLVKVGLQLDMDVEFNRLLQPLLNSGRPLQVLQSLIKKLFGKGNFTSVVPFTFLFYLAKRFLGAVVEVESLAGLMKWLEVFIPEVVVPWIGRMGGWGVVVCALGAILAGGLLVGLKMLLMNSKS
ncbi:uncharacterized protein LOC144611396 [Rhinoraja longicauda]